MDNEKIIIKDFKHLLELNPPAVFTNILSVSNDYIERPIDGWIEVPNGFIGIAYYGNEQGFFEDKWTPLHECIGHLPPKGYG